MKKITYTSLLLLLLLFTSCKKDTSPLSKKGVTQVISTGEPLFTLINSDISGIDFINYNKENKDFNYYAYEYFYNGGGVATADFNNDGLLDIVFTANMAKNKLFLNKGNLKFEDITQRAGINSSTRDWCTGVTVVDINDDGWQDIFISRSGWFNGVQSEKLRNLLFVNNKDLTFTERGVEYGFTDESRSTQACFFDKDNDGDLDMYLINNPKEHSKTRKYKDGTIKIIDVGNTYQDSDKLYENQNGKYVDVTQRENLVNADYGLGIIATDLNNDGWQDLYIGNDYSKPDAVLMNNKKGGFTNETSSALKHMSKFSMGVDAADINNDGLTDIFNAEMLGVDNFSKKVNMASMDEDLYWGTVNSGFHYQDMHNSLQINNGNGTFSEIAWMANVAETDWSWCPLLADFDNDGFKDLFVTNGVKRDVFNKDFMINEGKNLSDQPDLFELKVNLLPSKKVFNPILKNNGDLTFSNVTENWGLKTKAFNSNGAAYADLDNDGDLDLIVNNLEDKASLYKNNTNNGPNKSITIGLTHNNKPAYGAKLVLTNNVGIQMREITNVNGFQSASDMRAHFGVAEESTVSEVRITWPDGKNTTIKNIEPGSMISVAYENSVFTDYKEVKNKPLMTNVTHHFKNIIPHKEIEYDDYERELLLPHKLSQEGPFLDVADVNGDGLDDFFQGNGTGHAGRLYIQNTNGGFRSTNEMVFQKDANAEDLGVLFFDFDNDGDQDLYVVSGSNEDDLQSSTMNDRLYENDGEGNFMKTHNVLPEIGASGSCVIAGDIDNDGDLDLFVGGFQIPGKYPQAGISSILKNEGGVFKNVTQSVAPGLERLGMVKDAVFVDIDNDKMLDLIVAGHWMPISIFINNGAGFTNQTETYGLDDKVGWWNTLAVADFDNNGTKDIMAGNLGLNTKHKATLEKPFKILAKDFDGNGTNDIALGYYNNDQLYPVRGLQCSAQQNPDLTKNISSYTEFASMTFDQVYAQYDLYDAIRLEASYFASSIFYNKENKIFNDVPLPNVSQVAPTNGILLLDIDNDTSQEILTVGNHYPVEVETGRYDAATGSVIKMGDTLVSLPTANCGFFNDKDGRDIHQIIIGGTTHIMVSNNRDNIQFFKIE